MATSARRLSRPFLAAACALALASGLFAWLLYSNQDAGSDVRTGLLRDIRTYDSQLNEAVLAAQAGRLRHYDGLVRDVTGMQAAIRQLSLPSPASGSRHVSAESESLLKRLAEHGAHKAELIEAFKSGHAVYRNSLSFLPGALDLAIQESERLGQVKQSRLLGGLNQSLIEYLVSPSPDQKQGLTLAISTITDDPDIENGAPAPFCGHAQVILGLHDKLEDTVTAILSQPLAATVTSLQRLHELATSDDSARTRKQRGFILGIAVLLLIAVLLTLARLRRHAESLRHQAEHDSLTGLGNRVALHAAVERIIKLRSHNGNHRFALLMLDLDRFKEINDTLGHQSGDLLLKHIGPRLRAALPADTILARLGGDEFAVVLPGCHAREQAALEADKIVAALREPILLQGVRSTIGASIGITLYPEHGADSGALLRAADVAMYAAKGNGQAYKFYEPTQDQHTVKRLALITEVGGAIGRGELRLHYQPKLDLKTGEVSGLEALVRWQHPVHGLVPPMQFIPLIEQGGLIRPLTRWVLEEALRHMLIWNQAGLKIRTAVNISARNLLEPDLPDLVAHLLESFEGCSTCLEFEITETAFLKNADLAISTLNRLSGYGVHISIDDYGTGYSSLALLNTLPLDTLKIDRAFVAGMASDTGTETIVRSTIQLAHNLGLRVVAEGVEDAETLAHLRKLGCDEAQGYYILRPAPFEEITAWMAERGVFPADVPADVPVNCAAK